MPMRCDAEIARGDVCAKCGREHHHILTGWKIVIGVLAVGAVVAGIVWYLTSAAADEWKYERDRGPYKRNAHDHMDEETGEYRPQRVPRW
jgi:hypothetical protein